MNESTPIDARGLTKLYRGVAVVDHVDLTVQAGDIYGFLGPNGAGKTTTLRMLLALVRPDAGQVRLYGRDLAADPVSALASVAGIIEEPRLYDYLSGRRNLELLAAFDRQGADSRRIDEVLETVELREAAGARVGDYSQGMRQRLGIASCLVRSPRLMLLDEPANGVDPAGIRFLRDLLRRLAAEGTTILLSSHLLAEVQEVCDRVAVINRGRIVYEDSLAELAAQAAPRHRLLATDRDRALAVCRRLGGLDDLRVEGAGLSFSLLGEGGAIALTRALGDAGVGIVSLVREEAGLEELFFRLTEDREQSPAAAAR